MFDFTAICWLVVAVVAPAGVILNAYLVLDTILGDGDDDDAEPEPEPKLDVAKLLRDMDDDA